MTSGNQARATLFFMTALVALLSACGTLRVDSWSNPDFPNRAVGKVMVLGVGKTVEISRQYENLFIEQLNRLGVEADSMHRYVSREEMVTEDEIVEILNTHVCDSILVTRLRSEKELHYAVGEYPDHYWHYYGFYSTAFDARTVESIMEYDLETNLYDVKTRSLVWSGREVVYNDRPTQSNMKDVIKGLIKKLEQENMLHRQLQSR